MAASDVLKVQTPHVLITSILAKRQRFLIHLLSRLAFHGLICTMLCSTFCKGPPKYICSRSYSNYNKEQLENVLKQRLVSSSNFEEFFDTFLAPLNEYTGYIEKEKKYTYPSSFYE